MYIYSVLFALLLPLPIPSSYLTFDPCLVVPPEFTGYGKVAADLGKKVSLVCEVLSYPPASKIVFVRNGKELDVSTMKSNVDGSAHKQTMTHEIQSVSAGDYGSYLCIAVNSIGEANSTVSLIKTGREY